MMYNVKKFSVSGILAAVLILMLSSGNSRTFASTTGRQLADKVQNAISNYYDNNFNITANGSGVVTINGNINSLYNKYRIFDIVERIRGVKDIKDLITVNTAPVPDNVIRGHILQELKLNGAILEPNRIKVSVNNGEIVLRGDVSYYREKLIAESIASWQKGATGITDNIKVLPPKVAVSDKNLKIILSDILKDHFPVETKVNFKVNRGMVLLDGYTHTLWAKRHIARDFRRVKGVHDVLNHIITSPEHYANLA